MAQETTAHVAERVACNEYRESGIEWIGKIPRHWHVKRARFCMVANPVSRGLRDLQPGDEVSFVPMEAVGRGRLALERIRTVAARRVGYTEFQDGDVIVAKITPCFENGKGAVARELLNGVGIGTTELHVLRAGPGRVSITGSCSTSRYRNRSGAWARVKCMAPAVRNACLSNSARTSGSRSRPPSTSNARSPISLIKRRRKSTS